MMKIEAKRSTRKGATILVMGVVLQEWTAFIAARTHHPDDIAVSSRHIIRHNANIHGKLKGTEESAVDSLIPRQKLNSEH